MKNRPLLTISVPKLIFQLTVAFFIGYLIQQGFLEPWIHNRSISNWVKSLFEFLSILLFFAPIFYLLVYRDLQRKNQRYHHYLDQYKKFQVILDESPLGAFIYDQSGFLFVSKKFCNIVGYKEDEILGKQIQDLDFLDMEAEKLFNDNIKKRLANQPTPEYYIVSAHRKDGTQVEVEIRARLTNFDDHSVILGTINDVSERVKLETDLKESEQMYRRLFESNMDIVLMVDLNGFIIDINQVGERVSGYKREEIIGQHFGQLVYPVDFPKVEALYEEVLQGKSIRYEAKGMNKAGGVVDVMVSAMPLHKNGQITGNFAFIRDISKEKQHLQIVQKWAYYDTLTGLPNRHYFNEKCLATIGEAKSKGHRAALMFLDLDRMKMVNDNLGHAAGDKLLQLSSERFQQVVNAAKGFLSRIGGDEFTVIIPQYQSIEEITNLAEALIQSLTAPFYIEDNYIQSKTSVGIALYPEHGSDMKTIMQAADIAMFEAKNSGGNHYKFHKPETDSVLQRQFDFENDFSRAINNREFFLVYQPKVDAETRKIKGVEALVRWEHPVKGHISPADFIPMAEVSGLIVPLGEWVLREACSQAKQWQKLGLTQVRIAVNASALQFQQSDFSEKVKEILQETELDPQFLEIEITEGTFMEENEIVVTGVAKLMEMGVYISLDDFGTGYSSMKYLKQFRVQALKIDRAFIDKVDKYRERAAIVRSIVHLAHGLGMEVVAEGVETEEEMKFTKEYGVNEIQGYYISKPLSKEEFQKLL